MKLRFLNFVIVLLMSPFAFSAKWYVDDNINTNDVYTGSSASGTDGAAIAGSTSAPFATLSYAISRAASTDTIFVDKGSFYEVGLNINKSITIIGAGPGNTIFTGNATVNRFATFSANNIILKNVTLRNYYTDNDGQVITMTGRTGIIFENIVVKDNQGGPNNGVNFLLSNSSVTFRYCLFSCSGWNANGGGTLRADNSTLNIEKCAFKEVKNFANSGKGGAIELKGAAPNVTITSSVFEDCSAVFGGAIYQESGTLTVTSSCFNDNYNQGNASDPTTGGGAYCVLNSSASTNANFTNCSFTGNKANPTYVKFDANASCDGGAVLFRGASGTFTFNKCSFDNIHSSAGRYDKGQDFYLDEGTISSLTISNCSFTASTNASGGNKVNIYNLDLEAADYSVTNCGTYTITGIAPSTSNALSQVWDSGLTGPSTVCAEISSLAACGVSINCGTETNLPVIVSCVPDKAITGTCSTTLLDYRAEVAAFDDCSFTVSQSPAAGTVITSGTTSVTMTVTDQAGNSSTCSFNVVVSGTGISAPIVGAITQPTCSISSGSVELSGLPTPGTWTLTPSVGSAVTGSGATYTFTGLAASATYTFVVANSGGCLSSSSSNVTINAQPSTPAPSGSTSQNFCINQGATVNDLVASGTTIQWYLNPTGGTALTTSTALINNTHYYASQTVTGCESATRLDVLVTITPLPVAGTLSAGDPTLCSGTSTTVSSTESGGTWSSSDNAIATVNASTGLVNGIAAGTAVMTYTVSGTSTCSATSATATINIDVTQAPDAGTLSALDETLCSGTSTTVSSTISGGSWSSSNNAIATVNSSSGLVNAISAGTAVMTYTVSGTAGCSGTDATNTINIDVTQAPSTGSLSVTDATICSGTTSTVSSTISGGSWSSSDNAIATVNSSSGLVTGVAAGTAIMTYTVSGTAACIGTDATATINIDVTQEPDAGTLSAGDATLCSGTSTTVSSTISGGSWSSSNNAIATVNSSSGLVNAISAGTAVMTYTVSGTAGCSGIDATKTIDIDVTQTPISGTLTPVGASLCLGGTTTMSSNISGGTWVSDNPSIATIDLNTGLVTAIAVGSVNMTYTVNGIGACIGTNATASQSITIISSPTAGTLTALDSTLCQGTTTTASSTSLGGTWVSSNPGVVTVDPNSGLVTAISNGTSTLTYTVYGTGSCVGSNASATIDISVSLAPIAGTLSAVDPNLCAGLTTTVSSSVSGGSWTSSNASIASVNLTTGLVTAISAGTAVMTYTVDGTSYCLGTNVTATININVTNAPTTGVLTALDSSLCSGTTTTVNSTISGGSWVSSNPSVASIVSSTGIVSAVSAGSAIMTYTVNGSGVCTGVDVSGTITIDVTQAPIAGVISALDSTLCSGTTTIITSTVSGGTWMSSNTSVATVDLNTGLITAVSGGSTTMTYTVNGTGACIGTNANGSLTINVTSAPDAGTLSAVDATLCSGSTTTLSSTVLGGSWLSANNSIATVDLNNGLVTAISAGSVLITYTVNGTLACLGTSDSKTINISVTDFPSAGDLSSLDSSLCQGSTTTASSTVTGGLWTSSDNSIATIDSNSGLISAIGEGTAVMTYTVNGSGACSGMSASATLDIEVSEAPQPNNLSILDSALCSGTTTSVSSNITGGFWSSLDTTIAIVNSTTGEITAINGGNVSVVSIVYTILGSGACLGSDLVTSININVTNAPNSGSLQLIDSTLCSGTTTSAYSSISGGVWSTSDNAIATVDPVTGLVSAISNGSVFLTYTVSGTGACLGTNDSDSILLNVNQTPINPIGNLDQSFCNSDNPILSNLDVTPSNGINWYDTSVGGNLLLNSTALSDGGIYYASQTVNGCESILRLPITIHLSFISMQLVKKVTPKCNSEDGVIEVLGVNGIGSYTYLWSNGSNSALNNNVGSGIYSVILTDSIGCEVSQSFDLGCTESLIPQIISPNGNGKNDNWILNLDAKAKVEIYNRWGNLVYSASPYNDNWDGKPNVGDATGKDYLPSGTYFYIINKNNGEKPSSGYIELVR